VTNTVDALILDLLEWIGPRPRPYAEVIEAWRTSCPACPCGRRPMSAASSITVTCPAAKRMCPCQREEWSFSKRAGLRCPSRIDGLQRGRLACCVRHLSAETRMLQA